MEKVDVFILHYVAGAASAVSGMAEDLHLFYCDVVWMSDEPITLSDEDQDTATCDCGWRRKSPRIHMERNSLILTPT